MVGVDPDLDGIHQVAGLRESEPVIAQRSRRIGVRTGPHRVVEARAGVADVQVRDEAVTPALHDHHAVGIHGRGRNPASDIRSCRSAGWRPRRWHRRRRTTRWRAERLGGRPTAGTVLAAVAQHAGWPTAAQVRTARPCRCPGSQNRRDSRRCHRWRSARWPCGGQAPWDRSGSGSWTSHPARAATVGCTTTVKSPAWAPVICTRGVPVKLERRIAQVVHHKGVRDRPAQVVDAAEVGRRRSRSGVVSPSTIESPPPRTSISGCGCGFLLVAAQLDGVHFFPDTGMVGVDPDLDGIHQVAGLRESEPVIAQRARRIGVRTGPHRVVEARAGVADVQVRDEAVTPALHDHHAVGIARAWRNPTSDIRSCRSAGWRPRRWHRRRRRTRWAQRASGRPTSRRNRTGCCSPTRWLAHCSTGAPGQCPGSRSHRDSRRCHRWRSAAWPASSQCCWGRTAPGRWSSRRQPRKRLVAPPR